MIGPRRVGTAWTPSEARAENTVRDVARLLEGNHDAGVADLRSGLQSWSDLGTGAFMTWSRTWLVEALIDGGDLEGASKELDEVDRMLALGEERLAELRRAYVGGLLHRAQGDTRQAAAEFRNVVDLARRAEARGPEQQAEAALEELAR